MNDSERKTDEIFITVETPPPPEQDQTANQETVRFIDVHIYDDVPLEEIVNDQEPLIVDQEDTTPVQPRRKYTRTILLWLVSIIGLIVIGAIITALVLPLLVSPPPVNVTIIPVPKRFDSMLNITIPARQLPTLSMSQAKTVATTGYGHSDAKQATGYVTFFNSALYPQTIEAGTLLTGSDGVQVVTDQVAYIPAGNLATNGQATVLAHAVTPGPQGNIQASDIYGACCRQNIMVANTAFSGGQVARNYRVVSQQDIDTAVADLKSGLQASIQAAFQAQTQAGESLLPLTCTTSSKPDHAVGTEATQVQVVVSTSCTGFVYNTEALQQQVTQIVTQEASKQFGSGYALAGTISDTITQATPKKDGSIALQVRITANYSYQFSSLEQQHMINAIAGKSRNEATSTLLHMPGVQRVSVSAERLPTDTQDIRLLVIYEQ